MLVTKVNMIETPQVTALRSLQEHFTTEQIQQIANACTAVSKSGWGEVTLVFENHTLSKFSETRIHKTRAESLRRVKMEGDYWENEV